MLTKLLPLNCSPRKSRAVNSALGTTPLEIGDLLDSNLRILGGFRLSRHTDLDVARCYFFIFASKCPKRGWAC